MKTLELATNRYNSFEVPFYSLSTDVNGKTTKAAYDAYAAGYRFADFQLINKETDVTYEFDDTAITEAAPNRVVITISKTLSTFTAGNDYHFQVTIKKAAEAQPTLVVSGAAIVLSVLATY